MYYLAFGMPRRFLRRRRIRLNVTRRFTLGRHLYVGQHPRECSTLCPHLPIRELSDYEGLALLKNVLLVHHHGDARAPLADRPLQSVFSCLRVLGRTDHAPFPIRAYPSPRLRPRDLSQRLHRECAQSLYEVSQGDSPGDIFPRPRWRG
jgi:hypothetical protein